MHSFCKILTLIYSTLSFSVIYAQAPDTLWTKSYGGPSGDKSYSVQQTSDGGYIVTGYTSSYGAGFMDVYLIKTDSLGDTLWTKTYGGTSHDRAYEVQETTDGGYIVVGSTESYGIGFRPVYLIKTDSIGDTLWTKTYGWTNANNIGHSVQQTSDGGYIIGGWTVIHMLLIKTDANGEADWIRDYGITGHCGGYCARQTSDGGYILAGFSYTPSTYDDFCLVKTDSVGDTLWTRIYYGTEYDRLYSVLEAPDGGYVAVGGIGELYSEYGANVYIMKTDVNGNPLWAKSYGGNNDDVGFSIQQVSNRGYIITGRTYSFGGGDWDIYVLRTDLQGDTLWTTTYGDYGTAWGEAVEVTTDGGYIIAGWRGEDVYLVKTAPDIFSIAENQTAIPKAPWLEIYPNPFRKYTDIRCQIRDNSNIELRIYDITGCIIKDFSRHSSAIGHRTSVIWFGDDDRDRKLPSGVYFLKLESADYSATEKLLLIR